MARLMIAAILLMTAGQAAAQEASAKEDTEAVTAAWKARDQGRLLDADALFRSRAFDAAGRPKRGLVYQQWVQFQAELTNVAAASSDGDIGRLDPAAPGVDRIDAAIPRDAIATIAERAKTARVVILNEHHSSPRDRAFALEVARALRPLGYTMLGAETFNTDPDPARRAADMQRLARDGYPRRMTGTYTRDPVFGDFVRQALALGYVPFAYETTDYSHAGTPAERIARREEDQAGAIAQVLRDHPGAKLLVHVGFSHVTEQPLHDGNGAATRWMATRLKAMTGIDPLTIDQTILSDAAPEYRGLYARVAGKVGRRPVVMFDGAEPLVLGNYRGAVDLQVAHPPLVRVGGRPDWLAGMGRTPTPIPAALLPAKGTRLVQAFVAAEADDAIPVDQVLVTAGEAPPVLMLPAVPVRFAVQDTP